MRVLVQNINGQWHLTAVFTDCQTPSYSYQCQGAKEVVLTLQTNYLAWEKLGNIP